MLGLGLHLWSQGGSAANYFNPASISLTGWWRGSYTGSPWEGVASAGTSGSEDLVENTNAPSAGTLLNGYAPAVFDGSNDQLGGSQLGSFFTGVGGYLWWALFYSTATGGGSALSAGYGNIGLWMDGSAFAGSAFRANGGNEYIQVFHANGPNEIGNEHQISLNTWNLICVRYDGTDIRSKLNSGSVLTATATDVAGSDLIYVGRNYNATTRYTGRLMELGFMGTAETDGRFDDIKEYINGRYALGL